MKNLLTIVFILTAFSVFAASSSLEDRVVQVIAEAQKTVSNIEQVEEAEHEDGVQAIYIPIYCLKIGEALEALKVLNLLSTKEQNPILEDYESRALRLKNKYCSY